MKLHEAILCLTLFAVAPAAASCAASASPEERAALAREELGRQARLFRGLSAAYAEADPSMAGRLGRVADALALAAEEVPSSTSAVAAAADLLARARGEKWSDDPDKNARVQVALVLAEEAVRRVAEATR